MWSLASRRNRRPRRPLLVRGPRREQRGSATWDTYFADPAQVEADYSRLHPRR